MQASTSADGDLASGTGQTPTETNIPQHADGRGQAQQESAQYGGSVQAQVGEKTWEEMGVDPAGSWVPDSSEEEERARQKEAAWSVSEDEGMDVDQVEGDVDKDADADRVG